MGQARASTAWHTTNAEIEAKAKDLCAADGHDPEHAVAHAYGDDFTILEWEYRWSSNAAIVSEPVVSPIWRTYRARAAIELSRAERPIRPSGTVIPFRRRSA
jgi:hypothetical protein